MSRRKPTNLHVVDHPLLGHLLAEARDRRTPPGRFRQLLAQLGQLLAYEAMRDWATEAMTLDTPMEPTSGRRLRGPVTIVPILRAGLGLAEGIAEMLPEVQIGHIGMFRDERKLSPVSYYDKLPRTIHQGPVLLVDPMLATGGSAIAAIALLQHRNCRDIRLLCLVAAPEGLAKLQGEYPHIPIYTAALDRELDDRGYILPGLGDAGDRLYGTGE